jgi:hypothetical protein
MCKREYDDLSRQADRERSSCRDEHDRAEREIGDLRDSLAHRR